MVWQPIETAREEHTVLLWMVLNSTGEPLGHDIGWLEDDDWMLMSLGNEPSQSKRPTHWAHLPPQPDTN